MHRLTAQNWQDRQPETVEVNAGGLHLTYPGGQWELYLDFADTRVVGLTQFGGQLLWRLDDRATGSWLIPVGIPGETRLRQALQSQFPGFDGHSMYRVLSAEEPLAQPVTLWQR